MGRHICTKFVHIMFILAPLSGSLGSVYFAKKYIYFSLPESLHYFGILVSILYGFYLCFYLCFYFISEKPRGKTRFNYQNKVFCGSKVNRRENDKCTEFAQFHATEEGKFEYIKKCLYSKWNIKPKTMDSDDDQYLDLYSDDENYENMEFAVDFEAGDDWKKESDGDDDFFKVLSTKEIVEHMTKCINEVNTVVRMPATTTRILLNHFKWDGQKLMEKFYEGDQADQEKLFKEARVINPFKKDPKRSVQPKEPSSQSTLVTVDCEICCSTLPEVNMTGLDCGHRFCTDCWIEYLTTKIIQEGVGETIACAAHNCPILVDDESAMRLIKNSRVKEKYQHLITNSFVECNKLLRWCPSPDCNYAIKVQQSEARSVTCKCGTSFCFQCGENRHDPVKCKYLREWVKKCNEELQTFNWMDKNTKECPACKSPIEKNGGCNYIICGKQNCRQEFCWICLKSTEQEVHEDSCNRYFDKNNRENLENSRAILQRYLFYSDRYMNHKQSLNFENKLYKSVEKKMIEMMKIQNMSWSEVQFLKEAVNILCLCRQTLMYTYIFPYFLKKNNQLEIFENNQQDLENATESLSGYLEREITEESFTDMKQKVQDKSSYCSSRRKVLLKHVREGHDNDWWEYLYDLSN